MLQTFLLANQLAYIITSRGHSQLGSLIVPFYTYLVDFIYNLRGHDAKTRLYFYRFISFSILYSINRMQSYAQLSSSGRYYWCSVQLVWVAVQTSPSIYLSVYNIHELSCMLMRNDHWQCTSIYYYYYSICLPAIFQLQIFTRCIINFF